MTSSMKPDSVSIPKLHNSAVTKQLKIDVHLKTTLSLPTPLNLLHLSVE